MAKKENLKLCPECYKALEVVYRGNLVYCERCSYQHEQSPARANPWRYVERDGNPTEEGAYTVALKFQDATAVSQDVWQETFWLYHRDPRIPIYAYRLPPEPPPLEPEGDDQ